MNGNIKSRMRDEIIVQMQQYVTMEILQILDQVLVEIFEEVDIEPRETLPAEVKDSVDEQNKYIIQLFLYKKSSLAKGTLEGYLNAIKMLLTYTDKVLTDITDIDITGFLRWYENRNVARTGKQNKSITVNNARKFLSAFFGWLRKEKFINYNPVETVQERPVSKMPIDFFSRTELTQLREACKDVRERAILETLRSTGARVGELIGINRFYINWDTGDVMIQGEKGGKYRPLYLDEECRYYLKRYLESREDNNPALFIGKRKPYTALQREGIRAILKEIGNRAGLHCRVYPHKLRKTLGMDLRNKGVEIGTIQEIMGHSDPAVTAKYYAESTTDTLRDIRRRTA